jgi:chitinase
LDGLFQSFTPNYNIIEYNKINGSQNRHWDDISKSPWIYSPDDGIMISYDDVQSVTEKCHFVSNKNFGGFFFWELSQDIPSGQPNSLLDTVNKCVKGYHGGQNKSKCKAEVFPPNNSRFRDFPILNCPE